MADPVKIFLTSSLITTQNLVVFSHTVCALVRGPKIWGTLGAPAPWDGGVADPKKHAPALYMLPYRIFSFCGVKPFWRGWGFKNLGTLGRAPGMLSVARSCPICVTNYHTKFRCPRSNRLGVRSDSNNFGDAGARPLGMGAWLTLVEISFSPPVLPWRIRPFSAKPVERNYGDLPEKNDPLCPAFQGHSMSLEPTWIDRIWFILITFHSNFGPVRTISEINGDICNIFPPLVFNAPAELGVPLVIL